MQRFWNGAAWTAYVVDHTGQQLIDDPGATSQPGSQAASQQLPSGTATGHGIVIQNIVQAAPQPQPMIAIGGFVGAGMKSRATAGWLAFLFGPLGMFYATTQGAVIMLIVSLVLVPVTLGVALLVTVPVCIIWSLNAVDKHNAALMYAPGFVPQPISPAAPVIMQPSFAQQPHPVPPPGFPTTFSDPEISMPAADFAATPHRPASAPLRTAVLEHEAARCAGTVKKTGAQCSRRAVGAGLCGQHGGTLH
jgi:hypothetical protein